METTNRFNIKRFLLLLRNDLFRNYRTLLIGAGTVAAIYFIATLAPLIFSQRSVDSDFHSGFFPAALYICGFLLSAAAFSEIHHSQKNTAFFMLPATRLEKLASRLLLTTIGFVVIGIIFYFLLNLLSFLITALFSTAQFSLFYPFSREMLLTIAVYLVAQSLFLFGGIYFKSHAFMKTGLALFGFAVATALFSAIIFRIVYHDFFYHMQFMDNYLAHDFIYLEDFSKTLFSIAKYLFWLALAPFFWMLSYIRLGEKEV